MHTSEQKVLKDEKDKTKVFIPYPSSFVDSYLFTNGYLAIEFSILPILTFLVASD